MKFKDYNGNIIDIPTHIHEKEDTQRCETIAYATNYTTGFMRKEDVQKLNELEQQANFIDEKMKEIVYIK